MALSSHQLIKSLLSYYHTSKVIRFFGCCTFNDAKARHSSEVPRHNFHNCLQWRSLSSSNFGVHSNSVFTSSHYQLGRDEVKNYALSRNMEFREMGEHVHIKDCPFCPKPTKNLPSNQWKLGIHKIRGVYHCFRCEASGSWFDFKAKISGLNAKGGVATAAAAAAAAGGGGGMARLRAAAALPNQELARAHATRLMDDRDGAHVRRYLEEVRGLKASVLREYGVGTAKFFFRPEPPLGRVAAAGTAGTAAGAAAWEALDCVTFPWVVRREDLSVAEARGLPPGLGPGAPVIRRVKARALRHKGLQRLEPAGTGGWGLFGLHAVPPGAREVVLTEGEYDAMAVRQATGLPAVSLPNGCRSLPPECLPLLERFDKIYLWLDDDAAGHEGLQRMADKLGPGRTLVVRPLAGDPDPPKDANDALLKGTNMRAMLGAAALLPNEDILTFADVRADVLHRLAHPEEFVGTPIKSLPALNRVVKGLRRGELSVLTGPTGSGKTTLLSQMSLDVAEAGVGTLWGSFEVKNVNLLEKMLKQFARGAVDLSFAAAAGAGGEGSRKKKDARTQAQIDSVLDQFGQLPLHFLRFHGGTELDRVLAAMDYAVYAYDAGLVVLDNLQFMVPTRPATPMVRG